VTQQLEIVRPQDVACHALPPLEPRALPFSLPYSVRNAVREALKPACQGNF
jgi:hypothetical protein